MGHECEDVLCKIMLYSQGRRKYQECSSAAELNFKRKTGKSSVKHAKTSLLESFIICLKISCKILTCILKINIARLRAGPSGFRDLEIGSSLFLSEVRMDYLVHTCLFMACFLFLPQTHSRTASAPIPYNPTHRLPIPQKIQVHGRLEGCCPYIP